MKKTGFIIFAVFYGITLTACSNMLEDLKNAKNNRGLKEGLQDVDNFAYCVGDVLLSDGTVIPYNAKNIAFTQEEKDKAIGILYSIDDEGKPRGWLGLHNLAGNKKVQWSTADDVNYDNIICTPSKSGEGAADTVSFTGDTNGIDNLYEYSKSICKTKEAWDYAFVTYNTFRNESTYYGAFGYLSSYGTIYNLPDDYKEGWYMPSIAELCYLYRNMTVLNSILEALNGVLLEKDNYWSASPKGNGDVNVWALDFSNGNIAAYNRVSSFMNVCCIRGFDDITDLTASYIYSSDSSIINVSWLKPMLPNIDGVYLSYTKNGQEIVTDEKMSKSEYSINMADTDVEYVFTLYAVDTQGNKGKESTVKITPKKNSVGDLFLADGTVLAFNENNVFLPQNQKDNAVGILYSIDDNGIPRGWLGIHSERFGRLVKNDNYISQLWSEDKAINWTNICELDSNAETNAKEDYPVFYYANTYGITYNLPEEYKTGWYIPSLEELLFIYEKIDIMTFVFKVLDSGSVWATLSFGILSLTYRNSDFQTIDSNGNVKDCNDDCWVYCIRPF